jgi:hypothetical protein
VNTPNDLPAELKAELFAANFTDYSAAVSVINGGLRARYLTRLNRFWASGEISEKLHGNIGQEICDICDRHIARLAPVQCATTGWSSLPKSNRTGK